MADAIVVLVASVALVASFWMLISYLQRSTPSIGPQITAACNRYSWARRREDRPSPLWATGLRFVADLWSAMRPWRRAGAVFGAYRLIAAGSLLAIAGAVKPDLYLWAYCMLQHLAGSRA